MKPISTALVALTLAASVAGCASQKRQAETRREVPRQNITQPVPPPPQVREEPAQLSQPGVAAPDATQITLPQGASGCNCSCLSNPQNPPVVTPQVR